MAVRRTDLIDFLLDLVTFVEEKLQEALKDSSSQAAAMQEAGGAIPVMIDRLAREDESLLALFMLLPGLAIEPRIWRQRWDELANMKRDAFVEVANRMLADDGPVAAMKSLLQSRRLDYRLPP